MKKKKITFLAIVLILLATVGLIKPVFGAQLDALKKRFLEILVMNDDSQPVPVKMGPIQIKAPKASTKTFVLGNTFLNSGETTTALDIKGSGTFYGLWYSANSPITWARIAIDGEQVWKDHTHIFCLNWTFFNHSVGFAGATNCNESPTHLGDVWGGYITPPTGFPFKESLKVEFGNDDNSQKLIYSVRGYYSVE